MYTQIKAFITVVQEKTVTAAAKKLDCHFTGILAHIKNLEASLGIELFYHEKKRLNITEHGKKFYDMAVLGLNGLESLYDNIIDSVNSTDIKVNIAGHYIALDYFVPKLLSSLDELDKHNFHFQVQSKNDVISSIINKTQHFGIYPLDEREVGHHPEIEFYKLKPYDMVVLASKDISFAIREGCHGLDGHSVIYLAQDFISGNIVDGINASSFNKNITAPQQYELAKKLVKLGLGITFCGRDILTPQDKESINVVSRPPMMDLKIYYYLLHKKGECFEEKYSVLMKILQDMR